MYWCQYQNHASLNNNLIYLNIFNNTSEDARVQITHNNTSVYGGSFKMGPGERKVIQVTPGHILITVRFEALQRPCFISKILTESTSENIYLVWCYKPKDSEEWNIFYPGLQLPGYYNPRTQCHYVKTSNQKSC